MRIPDIYISKNRQIVKTSLYSSPVDNATLKEKENEIKEMVLTEIYTRNGWESIKIYRFTDELIYFHSKEQIDEFIVVYINITTGGDYAMPVKDFIDNTELYGGK